MGGPGTAGGVTGEGDWRAYCGGGHQEGENEAGDSEWAEHGYKLSWMEEFLEGMKMEIALVLY